MGRGFLIFDFHFLIDEGGDVVDEVGDGEEGLGIGHVDGDVVGGLYGHDEVDDVDGFKTEVGLETEVGSDGVERNVVEKGGHYLGDAGENFFVHCYSGFCFCMRSAKAVLMSSHGAMSRWEVRGL